MKPVDLLAAVKGVRVSRLGWMAFAIAAGVILLDQLTKSWIVSSLFPHHCEGFIARAEAGSRCIVPVGPLLNFNMVWNPGMSFGLFRGHGEASRWGLAIFAVTVTGLIGWWAHKAEQRLFATAAGLLMAGALGNVFDRFRFGAVVDFIDVSPMLPVFPWIFNVADSAITVGATLLLAEAILPSLRSRLASRPESGN